MDFINVKRIFDGDGQLAWQFYFTCYVPESEFQVFHRRWSHEQSATLTAAKVKSFIRIQIYSPQTGVLLISGNFGVYRLAKKCAIACMQKHN